MKPWTNSCYNIFSGSFHPKPGSINSMPLTTYPASLHKRHEMHYATHTNGSPVTLKGPCSDVQIDILNGTHGTLVGHVELNPYQYLEHIPDNECIITAIPDFEFISKTYTKENSCNPKFQIKLKHTLQEVEDLNYIKVRHGDIYKGIPFDLIPHKDNSPEGSEIFWEADIDYITITTTHFSQFLCTSCKVVCDTSLVAVVTGTMKEINSTRIAESVLFMCPPQYVTNDYLKVSVLCREGFSVYNRIWRKVSKINLANINIYSGPTVNYYHFENER